MWQRFSLQGLGERIFLCTAKLAAIIDLNRLALKYHAKMGCVPRILPSDTRRSVLQVFCAAWHRVIPMSETIRHSVSDGPLFPGYIDEWIIADSQTSTAGIAHAACYEEIFLAFKKSRVLCGMVQSDVATRLSYSAGTKSPTASSRLHQDLFNPTVFFSSRQFTILTDMPRRLRDSLYRSVSGPAVAGDLHVLFGMWLFKLS